MEPRTKPARTAQPPMRGISPGALWRAHPETALAVVFFVLAVVAITSTRLTSDVALIWPCNAIAAAVLIRLARVRWVPAFTGLLVAGVLANLLAANDPWAKALGLSAVNLLEIAAMVYVFRT